jgi:hypothetical protein
MNGPRDTIQLGRRAFVVVAVMATLAIGACQARGTAPVPSPGAAPTPDPGASPAPADPLPAAIATLTCDDLDPHGIGFHTLIDRTIVPVDQAGIRVAVRNLASFEAVVELRGVAIQAIVMPIAPGDGYVLLPIGIGDYDVRCNRAFVDRVGPGPADDMGWVELRVVDRDRYLDPIGSGCLYGGAYGAWIADGARSAVSSTAVGSTAVGSTATTPRAPCRV